MPLICLLPPSPLKVQASLRIPGNYGVFGPSAERFAVLKPDHGLRSRVLLHISASGQILGQPDPIPAGEIVGVTPGGSYAIQPASGTLSVPGDFEFTGGSMAPMVAVTGKCTMYFDFLTDKYTAFGPFGLRTFSAPSGRGTAVSLWEQPPTAAIFDAERPKRLLVRDLERNRQRIVSLTLGPAIKFQQPEIHLGGSSKAYFLANEESVRTRPADLQVLREREAEKGEAYYVRYLVEVDLSNGSCRLLARVETPGRSGADLRTGRSSPRTAGSAGRDIVVMERFLVVRADERIFILSR